MLFERNDSNDMCLLYGKYFELVAYINVQWEYIVNIENENTYK
jgi:hypothetical protein